MTRIRWKPADCDASKVQRPDQFPVNLRLLRWLGKQTWIPKGQDRLLRLIWSPDSGHHFCFEVAFFGTSYEGDLAHYIDWMVFAYGAYAYRELSLMEELAAELKRSRGRVHFFDVGANAGHHTLFMAPRVDTTFAFEPFPELLALLHKKVEKNHLDSVEVLPLALGEEDASLDYFPGAGTNSGVGTLVPDGESEHVPPIKVCVRNGDRLFDERQMPRIDLLKIDTEGFEPFVLRGLRQRIHQDRPAVLMELCERTRTHFGSEENFRKALYPGAVMAEVAGREGCRYCLRPFRFDSTEEVVIAPPELDSSIRHLMH